MTLPAVSLDFMITRMRACGLCVTLFLLSWAIVGGFIGCSNENQHITPPVVGPAAGSGPMGGGDTQSLQLTASPSKTLTTIDNEQGRITVTALVENSIGQAMPDGTPIYWSTTEGTVAPTVGTSSHGAAEAIVTFPAAFDGCSDVTARSGDVSARIRLCVANVKSTPTPVPTASPAPTPVINVSLESDRLSGVCGAFTANLTATVYRNSIVVTDIPVAFSVSFSPALNAGTTCSVNPTNPPLGTTTSAFSCSTCSGTGISIATIRATASGKTAEVSIAVTQ